MGAARPEAAFYRWRALTEDQRRVASDLHSWLSAFAMMPIPLRAAGNSIFDWQRIDDTRASNVIVIDGPRGAGKTSLMLTLVELWRRSLAQDNLEEVFGMIPPSAGETDLLGLCDCPQNSADDVSISTRIIEARTSVEALRGRIIPIRVLDFSPLPRSTSLVTWVAAQLREFIDLLDERTSPALSEVSTRTVVPWEPDWDKELPSRKAWAELTGSAAWGWDDNIQARKGTLDPDAYAEELQQSERARVGIVERWRTLIGTVVKDAAQRYRGRINEHARIVIPIDDVDMNPQRAADLLEFVHTFWDPQLVFLLTGDSNLILDALKEHHAKALGMSGNETSDSGLSRREMAAQSYDKVIPLGQRFRLGPLKPNERVTLLREQLGVVVGGAPSPSPPMRLADVLRLDHWTAEALPATLREIHDARQKLTGLTKVSDVVAEIWSDVLSREARVIADRKAVLARVDLGGDGMPSVEADIDARAERLGEFRIPAPDSPTQRRVGRTHLVLEGVSGLVPLDMPESARLRGAVLLAADLAANDPDAAWSTISIAGHGYKCPAVRARIVVTIGAQDRAGGGRAEKLLRKGVRWPVPDWPAPMDVAAFAEGWRKHIPPILARRGDQTRDREIATLFLDRIRSVHEGRATQPAAAPSLTSAMTLVIADGKQTTPAAPRQQAYIEWARGRALLLAAPESGLQVSTVTELLSVVPGDRVSRSRAAGPGASSPRGVPARRTDDVTADPLQDFTALHQARFDRVRITFRTLFEEEVSRNDIDAMLLAIDTAFEGHPWVERFGKWNSERAEDER